MLICLASVTCRVSTCKCEVVRVSAVSVYVGRPIGLLWAPSLAEAHLGNASPLVEHLEQESQTTLADKEVDSLQGLQGLLTVRLQERVKSPKFVLQTR